MEDSYKVSGDAFYTDLNGKICLPLGTITVQEIDPPQGYLLDSTVYVQKLDRTSSTSEHIRRPHDRHDLPRADGC